MMCQRIGRPPTSTIGFGFDSDSSARRVPSPPASSTVFTLPPRAGCPRVSCRYTSQNVKRLTSRDVPAKRVGAAVSALAERLTERRIRQYTLDRNGEGVGRRLVDEFRGSGGYLGATRAVDRDDRCTARQRLDERHR